ncbi:MAG TPA: hypothetical protein VFI22_15555, partial [Thermomicrobiales bacterium]|nr:hypothetical protein [Thermomicrobiales bacterium]
IVAVTGSVGVGSGPNSKAGLAGTVTVNRIANVIEAKIIDSTFHADSTGDITVSATDNSFIFSFAGAFGASKSVGLGVAAAVNLLDNTISAEVINSTLRSTGSLDVNADATGTLVSVALGVGAGQQFAGAGSIALNIIDNDIDAQILDGSDIKVGKAIDISADDHSVAVAIGGGAAFGKTAAIGAAFAGSFITNTLTAKVDDSLVESTGSTAALGAEARATLVSIAIGGAGSQTFALGGSISVNQVENSIEALVTDANGAGTGKATLLKAKNDISIAASDDTTMVIVAGGLAFAQTAAIGVSASTAQVQNKVHAYIDASTVESTNGKISVTAGFKPPDTDADMKAIALGTNGIEMPEAAGSQIVNIAVGVAGSGTFAGGGAFSLNWIRNDVQAHATNSAVV